MYELKIKICQRKRQHPTLNLIRQIMFVQQDFFRCNRIRGVCFHDKFKGFRGIPNFCPNDVPKSLLSHFGEMDP